MGKDTKAKQTQKKSTTSDLAAELQQFRKNRDKAGANDKSAKKFRDKIIKMKATEEEIYQFAMKTPNGLIDSSNSKTQKVINAVTEICSPAKCDVIFAKFVNMTENVVALKQVIFSRYLVDVSEVKGAKFTARHLKKYYYALSKLPVADTLSSIVAIEMIAKEDDKDYQADKIQRTAKELDNQKSSELNADVAYKIGHNLATDISIETNSEFKALSGWERLPSTSARPKMEIYTKNPYVLSDPDSREVSQYVANTILADPMQTALAYGQPLEDFFISAARRTPIFMKKFNYSFDIEEDRESDKKETAKKRANFEAEARNYLARTQIHTGDIFRLMRDQFESCVDSVPSYMKGGKVMFSDTGIWYAVDENTPRAIHHPTGRYPYSIANQFADMYTEYYSNKGKGLAPKYKKWFDAFSKERKAITKEEAVLHIMEEAAKPKVDML